MSGFASDCIETLEDKVQGKKAFENGEKIWFNSLFER